MRGAGRGRGRGRGIEGIGDRKRSTAPFSSLMRRLNSLPSRMMKSDPCGRMPHLCDIERAVFTLSPVTMRTVMPARWHFRIASGTSARTGSSMPTIPRGAGQQGTGPDAVRVPINAKGLQLLGSNFSVQLALQIHSSY